MNDFEYRPDDAGSEKQEQSRVLLVDDNEDAAVSLALLLGTVGFKVAVAFSGLAALAKAEQFKPDACLLDINMPGMDGYELARKLRQGAKDRPLVLATMTALDDFQHLDRAANAGFDLHFNKLAEPHELIEQLRDALAPSSMSGKRTT
jgi:CheY-like chemotaxis protein